MRLFDDLENAIPTYFSTAVEMHNRNKDLLQNRKDDEI